MATGIGPADFLKAPPEVQEAIFEELEAKAEAQRQAEQDAEDARQAEELRVKLMRTV